MINDKINTIQAKAGLRCGSPPKIQPTILVRLLPLEPLLRVDLGIGRSNLGRTTGNPGRLCGGISSSPPVSEAGLPDLLASAQEQPASHRGVRRIASAAGMSNAAATQDLKHLMRVIAATRTKTE